MQRAAIYARVSSDPRGIGRSVDEQIADCRAIADREGWQVVSEFVDNDRSASRYGNGKRPEYERLVNFLRRGNADVLVTWEASRAQRDLDAYLKLRELCREANVLWSYSGRTYDLARTDDAFTTGLDALLAEREVSQTRDRIMRSVRANAEKGRPHGRVTYGYERRYHDTTGELLEQVVRDDQADVVREAARRVLAGETTYAIAEDFNRRDVPTPRPSRPKRDRDGNPVRDADGNLVREPTGGRWDGTQIKRLCTNPAYIGKRVHRGEIVSDAMWPPILDEDTYYALVAKLNDPKRRTQRDSAIKHLLSGIALCGVCCPPGGEPRRGVGRIRVQKNRGFLAYLCVDSFHVSRKKDPVDQLVTAVAIKRLERPDVLELLSGPGDEETGKARAEAAELRTRLDEFYEAAARGDISAAALSKIEASLLPQIRDAEERSHTATVTPIVREVAGADVAERWGSMPLSAKREVIDALMIIRILPAGAGHRTFDPELIDIEWRTG